MQLFFTHPFLSTSSEAVVLSYCKDVVELADWLVASHLAASPAVGVLDAAPLPAVPVGSIVAADSADAPAPAPAAIVADAAAVDAVDKGDDRDDDDGAPRKRVRISENGDGGRSGMHGGDAAMTDEEPLPNGGAGARAASPREVTLKRPLQASLSLRGSLSQILFTLCRTMHVSTVLCPRPRVSCCPTRADLSHASCLPRSTAQRNRPSWTRFSRLLLWTAAPSFRP